MRIDEYVHSLTHNCQLNFDISIYTSELNVLTKIVSTFKEILLKNKYLHKIHCFLSLICELIGLPPNTNRAEIDKNLKISDCI